jgi:hypothetical protein
MHFVIGAALVIGVLYVAKKYGSTNEGPKTGGGVG